MVPKVKSSARKAAREKSPYQKEPYKDFFLLNLSKRHG